jgi:hypothetical protein
VSPVALPFPLQQPLSMALFFGVHHGNPVLTAVALYHGATPSYPSSFYGITPLMLAAHYDNPLMLERFQLYGISPDLPQDAINRFYQEKAAFVTENIEPVQERKRALFEKLFWQMKRNYAVHYAIEEQLYEEVGVQPASWEKWCGFHILRQVNLDEGLKERIGSGEKTQVITPRYLMEDGNISKEEYWQIFREVTMLALMKQSLGVKIRARGKWQDVILPPVLRDTLTGSILIEAAYWLQSVTEGEGIFFFPEHRENVLNRLLIEDSETIALFETTTEEQACYAKLKQAGAFFLNEEEALAYVVEERKKRQALEMEWIKAAHPHLHFIRSYFAFDADHLHISYDQETLRPSLDLIARYSMVFYDEEGGYQRCYYPDEQSYLKEFNRLLSSHPFLVPVMSRLHIIYRLDAVACAMLSCERAPDFSYTPDFSDDYGTTWEVPPVQFQHDVQSAP